MTFDEWWKTRRNMLSPDEIETADVEAAWNAALKAEREACAEVCESFDACDPAHIAAAIRARQ